MSHYAVLIIADAHKDAANRLINDIEGDSGDNISQPLSATGGNPPTHWIGGRPVDAEWLEKYQSLAHSPHVPTGGYPLAGGVTEQQVQDAVAALYINVNTGEDAEALPTQNLTTVLLALGLQRIVSDV